MPHFTFQVFILAAAKNEIVRVRVRTQLFVEACLSISCTIKLSIFKVAR